MVDLSTDLSTVWLTYTFCFRQCQHSCVALANKSHDWHLHDRQDTYSGFSVCC